MTIRYGRQIVQDGTGKAPELAREFVGSDSFLLTYGDILVKPDTYGRMIARFAEDRFAGLATTIRGEDVTKGAVLCFDSRFLLRRLVEKPTPAQLDELRGEGWLRPGEPVWYNAGIYMFTPELFSFTSKLKKSPRGEYELTDAIIGMLNEDKVIAGLEIQGRWVDVRDPEVLFSLERGQVGETSPA